VSARVLDPLADPLWDERLAALPGATVFHTRGWAEVMARTYGFARHYQVLEQGPHLRALAPCMEVRQGLRGRRGVCLPYSDYVPLVADSPASRERLTAKLLAYARSRQWRSLELRGGEAWQDNAPASQTYDRHWVALEKDETVMFQRLRSNVRTAIRRAGTHGVQVARGLDAAGSEAFLHLNQLTRRRHGMPPQPVRFFRNIDRMLRQQPCGDIWVASWDGRPIAAALFLTHRDAVTFKYGGSDYRFQHLRPNDLLMWTAMCSYGAQGFRSLCLGRTDPANDGLRRFKTSLGAQSETLAYHTYDVRRDAFVTQASRERGWYGPLFRAMPLWANQCVGNLFYQLGA